MIVRNGKSPKFDIRKSPSLAYDGPENDMVEAAYDTVNRMAIFVGDIPIGTLYTAPWVKLALSCRIDEADECGLLNNPEAVWGAFDVLEAAGHMSWSKYLNGDVYREGDDDITRALASLSRQGIGFPHLSCKPNVNKKTMNLLNELIALAPDVTYKQVMTEPIDLTKVDVVRNAAKLHVFPSIPANHKCCDPIGLTCVPGTYAQTCYVCSGGSGSSFC